MRKKIIALFCAIVCIVVAAVPASASTDFNIVDYNDYVTNVAIDGDNDIVTVTFPLELCGITTKDMYGSRRWPNQRMQSIYLNSSTKNGSCGFYVPGSGITTTWIDLSNIPDGSEFSFSGDVLVADSLYYRIECTAWVGMQYYDVNGQSVGSQNVDKVKFQFTGDLERFYTYADSIIIQKPVGAVYGCFMVMVQVFADVQPDDPYTEVYFDYRLPTLKMSISSMYRLQQETGRTNDLLEKLPDKITDGFRDVIQEEQNKAELGGNSSVGALEELIPDHSAGFMNALQGFAASMSYNGTAAKLNIPGITMPQISGLIPEYQIMPPTTIDFEQYVQLLPEGLLLLVQSLLTIALIIYCFKELYDTISYILTLRRGADG